MNYRFLPVCLIAAISLNGCRMHHETMHHEKEASKVVQGFAITPPKQISKAVATLKPTANSQVSGTIAFIKEADGVRVQGTISGLTPGDHGFHVHQWGDCSATDATSAGGHFNPESQNHAAQHDNVRHVGDLGNVTADASGNATINFLDKKLSFEGVASIIGRGLIVHANPDDFKSQPTGNAGGRVACGVIGVVAEM